MAEIIAVFLCDLPPKRAVPHAASHAVYTGNALLGGGIAAAKFEIDSGADGRRTLIGCEIIGAI